jgi:hypothetical protein
MAIGILFLVSEWLLFNANSAIVQLYHVENKLILITVLIVDIIESLHIVNSY